MAHITKDRSETGMKFLYHRRSLPGITAMTLRIPAGAFFEEKNGIAHMTEHLVLDGTENFNKKKDLENLISFFGGRGGGKTNYENTTFFVVVPTEQIHNGLTYLKEISCRPLLAEDVLEKEKEIIAQEIHTRHLDLKIRSNEESRKILYPNSLLNNPVVGHESTVRSISIGEVKHFWTSRYHLNKSILSIVTDADEKVVAQVKDFFSDISTEGTNPDFSLPTIDVSSGGVLIFEEDRLDQCQIRISYPVGGYLHRKRIFADVLAAVLGAGKASRLFNAVRSELGLAYGISTYTSGGMSYGQLEIAVSVVPHKVKELIQVLKKELSVISEVGCSQAEIESAKKKIIFRENVVRESTLETALVLSLIGLYTNEEEKWFDIQEQYNSVTPKDVLKVAKEIFSRTPAVVVFTPKNNSISLEPTDFAL